jgi:hypothetical protein
MSRYHWTQREQAAFEAKWLVQRMPHAWSEDAPTRCTRCGAKFSPTSQGRRCPKRRKPNRWRVHLRRALHIAMYTPDHRPKDLGTAAYWLRELSYIRGEIKRVPELQPDHPRFGQYWKYHRLARRHRRALRELWRLPVVGLADEGIPADRWAGSLTAARNKLLREARATQARRITRGGCVYTFRADAVFENRPLFTEGG